MVIAYRKEEKRAIIDDVHTSFGYYLRFSGRCFVVDNPAAVVKAVVVAGGSYKNYLCGIFRIVFKNVRFPLKGTDICFRVGEVVLLIDWGVERDFVAALFQF